MKGLFPNLWKDNKFIILLILVVISFSSALLMKLLPVFPALKLKNIADANITELFYGAFFITLVIERSVEVFISVWRDPRKTEKTDKSAVKKYEQETATIAFYAGFFLGIVSALVGVRIFEPLVALAQEINENQLRAFRTLDILLTGLTISGGSKIFHELISIFTDFLTATRKRVDITENNPDDTRNPSK